MSKVVIYDKAMCCSTGVCGPSVDPVLPRFAADLDWLKDQGNEVHRYNLAQDPAEFASNATVQDMMTAEGMECLPLVFVDDRILSRNEYPSRANLALWTDTDLKNDDPLTIVTDESGSCE